MSSSALNPGSPKVPRSGMPAPHHDILPTLFGEGYGTYKVRPNNFLYSVGIHILAGTMLFLLATLVVKTPALLPPQISQTVTDISPYIMAPSKTTSGGGGGGGDRDKLLASKGVLPKFSLKPQIVPPAAVIRNDHPKLAVEPTVVVPPEIKMAHVGAIGDPFGLPGPPSNGTGSGGGIGSGSGGGVGSGSGNGVGPGSGGGIGGGVFRVGGGVSAPVPTYAPDPEFSEEARKAKHQGVVIVNVIVGPDGRAHEMRVVQPLGLGLDEKAIEAVRLWKFEPARKDGKAVAVAVNIEVTFRLY